MGRLGPTTLTARVRKSSQVCITLSTDGTDSLESSQTFLYHSESRAPKTVQDHVQALRRLFRSLPALTKETPVQTRADLLQLIRRHKAELFFAAADSLPGR